MKRKGYHLQDYDQPMKKRKIDNYENDIKNILFAQQNILNDINSKLNNINIRLIKIENIIEQNTLNNQTPKFKTEPSYFY